MILEDANGVFWQVGVSGLGQPTATVVGSGPGDTVFLSKSGASFQVRVAITGVFTQTAVSYNPAYPTSAPINGSYNLAVTVGGLLQTERVPPIEGMVLEDVNGGFWQVGRDSRGRAKATAIGSGPGDIIHITTFGNSWLIIVGITGRLGARPIAFNAFYPRSSRINLTSFLTVDLEGRIGVTSAATTYLGLDVLEIEPNDRDGKTANYGRSMIRLDSRTGGMAVQDRAEVAIVRRSGFVWAMDGRGEISEYKTWVEARRGALVPFWLPTWRHDLVMAADLVSGDHFLDLVNTGYTQYQFPLQARRHLAFLLPDGTKYYIKAIDSTDAGAIETIELEEGLPEDIDKDEVMLSFLVLSRLAVDDPELIWHTTRYAEAFLDIVELPQESLALEAGS